MMHKAMRSTRGTGRPGTRLWLPPHSRCLHGARQSHGRNLRTLLQLGYGACVLLRLGGLWPGLRGLTIKLPLIAFPAGVNAEGVMVFVNARGARGRQPKGKSYKFIHQRTNACPVQGPSAEGQVLVCGTRRKGCKAGSRPLGSRLEDHLA